MRAFAESLNQQRGNRDPAPNSECRSEYPPGPADLSGKILAEEVTQADRDQDVNKLKYVHSWDLLQSEQFAQTLRLRAAYRHFRLLLVVHAELEA
jgi:hypothetical protein